MPRLRMPESTLLRVKTTAGSTKTYEIGNLPTVVAIVGIIVSLGNLAVALDTHFHLFKWAVFQVA